MLGEPNIDNSCFLTSNGVCPWLWGPDAMHCVILRSLLQSVNITLSGGLGIICKWACSALIVTFFIDFFTNRSYFGFF